jgi:hypothetical protein
MQRMESNPDDDETPGVRTARQWLACVLVLVLLLVTPLLYGLHKLEHMPFRPPSDMSTLLGADEIEMVRRVFRLLAVVWVVVLVGLTLTLWQRRRRLGH